MTEPVERDEAQYLDELLDASFALVEHSRTLRAQSQQAHQRLRELMACLAAIATAPSGPR